MLAQIYCFSIYKLLCYLKNNTCVLSNVLEDVGALHYSKGGGQSKDGELSVELQSSSAFQMFQECGLLPENCMTKITGTV